MSTFRELLPVDQRLKYLAWRLTGRSVAITLDMLNGGRVRLRAQSSHTGDYGVAYEVFALELYRAELRSPKIIVDLGANVGYATLYFALRYPESHIFAFEPHPEHFQCLSRLVAMNGLGGRVTAFNCAAGVGRGTRRLSNQGTSSQVLPAAATTGIPVAIVDFYEWVASIGPIDLLKIDIEGGEFELLSDIRFPELLCRDVLLEAHSPEGYPNGARWCVERLAAAGFFPTVIHDGQGGEASMIHARRDEKVTGIPGRSEDAA